MEWIDTHFHGGEYLPDYRVYAAEAEQENVHTFVLCASGADETADVLKAAERKNDCRNDDRRIETDLDRPERNVIFLRYHPDETIARHQRDICNQLKTNPYCKKQTSNNFLRDPQKIGFRNIKIGQPHPEVDEKAERQQCGQLRDMTPSESAFQNDELRQNEKEIDHNGRHPQSPRELESGHIGQTGDRRCAEPRTGAECHPDPGNGQPQKE